MPGNFREELASELNLRGITLNGPEIETAAYWHTNAMMLKKILENLIVNGIDHR